MRVGCQHVRTSIRALKMAASLSFWISLKTPGMEICTSNSFLCRLNGTGSWRSQRHLGLLSAQIQSINSPEIFKSRLLTYSFNLVFPKLQIVAGTEFLKCAQDYFFFFFLNQRGVSYINLCQSRSYSYSGIFLCFFVGPTEIWRDTLSIHLCGTEKAPQKLYFKKS